MSLEMIRAVQAERPFIGSKEQSDPAISCRHDQAYLVILRLGMNIKDISNV